MINYYVSHVHVLGCYRQPQPMQHVDAERGVRAVMVVLVVVVVAATVKEKEEDNWMIQKQNISQRWRPEKKERKKSRIKRKRKQKTN